MNKKIKLLTLTLAMATFMIAGVAFAADPLEVNPEMYKLKFENEHVRVMEVTFQPGQAIPEHTHPNGHFVYVIQGGKLKITKSDGTANEVELKVGDVMWINAETHKAVNTGTTTVHLLVSEIKSAK